MTTANRGRNRYMNRKSGGLPPTVKVVDYRQARRSNRRKRGKPEEPTVTVYNSRTPPACTLDETWEDWAINVLLKNRQLADGKPAEETVSGVVIGTAVNDQELVKALEAEAMRTPLSFEESLALSLIDQYDE